MIATSFFNAVGFLTMGLDEFTVEKRTDDEIFILDQTRAEKTREDAWGDLHEYNPKAKVHGYVVLDRDGGIVGMIYVAVNPNGTVNYATATMRN